MNKTVEIAGGGIAGLTAAAVFARKGWQVRLHERADGLREIGAGIYLKENSLRVLERLGVYQELETTSARLSEAYVVVEGGRRIIKRDLRRERVIVSLRAELHRCLLEAAAEAGAEIITSSRVETARPTGTITLQGGRQTADANLVIGADGAHSRIRPTAGFSARVKPLTDGATRLLIPRTETEPWSSEHWSGRLRLGLTPCGPDHTYVFLIAPEADSRATRVPIDVAYWHSAFPYLGDVFERIEPAAGTHHAHIVVYCRSWRRGRVALIGDAAHAQPPNLGQGAGLAIANAWELAESVEAARDVESGLREWDARVRPVGQAVQRWSCRYGQLSQYWPRTLYPARSRALWAIGNWPPTRRRWATLWRGGLTEVPDPKAG